MALISYTTQLKLSSSSNLCIFLSFERTGLKYYAAVIRSFLDAHLYFYNQ